MEITTISVKGTFYSQYNCIRQKKTTRQLFHLVYCIHYVFMLSFCGQRMFSFRNSCTPQAIDVCGIAMHNKEPLLIPCKFSWITTLYATIVVATLVRKECAKTHKRCSENSGKYTFYKAFSVKVVN